MSQREPVISVITVALDSAATIAETLRSVDEQRGVAVEHIVVDGGSTDGSLALIKDREGRRWISERDRGIYDAMNKGLALATGDIIGFLNADDVFADADVLRRISGAFGPNVDAVFGDLTYFRDNPHEVARRYRSLSPSRARLARGLMPAHPALYVRRRLFEEVGGFDPSYRISGDFQWVARAFGAQSRKCIRINDALVRMRLGGVSTASWKSAILINREIRRACREAGIPTSWLRILSRYPVKLVELTDRRHD